MKEYLEIILIDFKTNYLDLLINQEFKITKEKIINSHFYDIVNQRDITFSEINNLHELYTQNNTGNILVNELDLGLKLTNAMIIFSFNEKNGDISITFYNQDFSKNNLKDLINYLIKLKNKYTIPTVKIGYDPADDDDMCIVKLIDDRLNNVDLDKIIESFMK